MTGVQTCALPILRTLLIALIAVCAFAEDDLYNPFLHGTTMLKRIRTIRRNSKNYERQILAMENRERKIKNVLDILYNDLKIAVDIKDRIKIETQVEGLQKQLDQLRKGKRVVLRRMRKVADKIALPERDRLVRQARIEHRIGLEENSHIRREIENNQQLIMKETQALAHKYAKMASEIAAEKLTKSINDKKDGDILKAKDKYKAAARHAYNKYYKKIVERIEEATSEGVDNSDIKMVCRSAIDGIIRKLQHQYLTIVESRREAKKVTKAAVKKPMRRSMKTLGKAFDKKIHNKVAKHQEKNAKAVVKKLAQKK